LIEELTGFVHGLVDVQQMLVGFIEFRRFPSQPVGTHRQLGGSGGGAEMGRSRGLGHHGLGEEACAGGGGAHLVDSHAAESGGEQEQECEAQGDALTDGERAEAHSDRWLDVVTFCRLGKGVSVTTEVPEARIDGR
jgi:hypothetical protein